MAAQFIELLGCLIIPFLNPTMPTKNRSLYQLPSYYLELIISLSVNTINCIQNSDKSIMSKDHTRKWRVLNKGSPKPSYSS